MIDWTILRRKYPKTSSKEFEKLALAYVKDIYPDLTWTPTAWTGDGNRDGYAALEGDQEIWEEAKYRNGEKSSTREKDRALEKKDVDSTVLSGLLYGKVRLIIFVTNTRMPDKVLVRSALGARIRGIEVNCVLAPQLEQWLEEHKQVYQDIFGEPFPCRKKGDSVISFNYVGLYDLKSVDFSPLKKKKEFYLGERALLEVVFYSSVPVEARLALSEAPFKLVHAPGYSGDKAVSCPAGMSTFFYLVQMERPMTGPISVKMEIGGNDYYQNTTRVSILPHPGFDLVYTQQQEVIFYLRQKLTGFVPFQQGAIATLYAGSSMGKSHVLQKMQEEFALRYDTTLITFDGRPDSMSNNTLLCKVLLFLVYGNVFWDQFSTQPNRVKEFKQLVMQTNTEEVFDPELLGAILDGCFDVTSAANTIRLLHRKVKQTEYAMIRAHRTKVPLILFLDDFQYLDQQQAEFMFAVFKQLNTYHNSAIVVISATKGKFRSKAIENQFLELTPNHYELKGLSASDKSSTLFHAFSLRQSPPHTLSDQILPNSPLLAREVLQGIARHAVGCVDIDDLQEIYLAHIQDTRLILQDKFSQCRQQFYLLDIVFKFKKGIPRRLLNKYPIFDRKQLQEDIKTLSSQNLIVEEDGRLKPYHDYYTAAYCTLRGKKFYNQELGEFLKYLLPLCGARTGLDYNQILAMLLRCGRRYARTYNAKAKKAIEQHIQHTQFGAARQLCEYYWEQIKSLRPELFSHEDWRLLYLYADCLVHCDQQHRAHDMLKRIYLWAPENSLEKYEAGASLLNQDFWEIQPDKVIADSFDVENKTKWFLGGRLSEQDRLRMVKAYSSSLNRRMASYLLLDNCENAWEVYIHYLKETVQLNRDTFQTRTAIIIMDLARGLSYWKPDKALQLMRVALTYFKSDPEHHYRRILICKVDLALLQSVNGKTMELQELMDTKRQLLEGEFLSEYVKAVMKQLVCELIEYSNVCGKDGVAPCAEILSNTEQSIRNALMDTGLQLHGRETAMKNVIFAFLAARRGDYDRAAVLLQHVQEIFENAGKSYQKAVKHNLKNIRSVTRIAWWTNQTAPEPSTFYVDCRFW